MTALQRQMIAAARRRRTHDVWQDEAGTDFEMSVARTRILARLETERLPLGSRLGAVVAFAAIGLIYLGGLVAMLSGDNAAAEAIPQARTAIAETASQAADSLEKDCWLRARSLRGGAWTRSWKGE